MFREYLNQKGTDKDKEIVDNMYYTVNKINTQLTNKNIWPQQYHH